MTIDGDFMCGGSKTDAGRNRRVPIHHKIKPLIEKRKGIGNITYVSYNRNFHKVMSALGLNDERRPHDPRKHFITQCKKYNVDEYAIKYMVGHSINDVTERVYTEREDSWLKSEIEKIP